MPGRGPAGRRAVRAGPRPRPRPATSGRAPPVVATTGVAHAIASTRGREKPSNSEGTAARSALRSSWTSSASERLPVKRTTFPREYRSIISATGPRGRVEPTTTSSTYRSVRTFAIASTSGSSPLRGTSALAVVTTRPPTRCTPGSGANRSMSVPIGITSMRSAGTPRCSRISSRDDRETVTTS